MRLSGCTTKSERLASFHHNDGQEAHAQLRITTQYGLRNSSSMIVQVLFAVFLLILEASAEQSPASKPIIRPCGESWKDSGANTKKNRSKSPRKETRNEAGACIELTFSTLEIQEYLQSYARTQKWNISEDRVNEDSWTFSIELHKDQLLRDTTEDSKNKRVEWTGGTVRVHVSTAQVPDGYARTTVRASFRGYGRSADQLAMQKEYWLLDSNNNLENSIVSALRSHFTATSSPGTRPSRISPEIPLLASRWNTKEWAPVFSD